MVIKFTKSEEIPMLGIFQATSRQPAPRRHQPLTAIGAAFIITGLTVLACGIVLAGDFVANCQEEPLEAVSDVGQPGDAALTETAPAKEPPAYESRAGLAIDLPFALRALLDDHDGVVLSEGPQLAQHQGLYVGLFLGDETEFERFGPDQGWINGAEDSVALADGTPMRRMTLTLDPAHGSGQGLILMRAEADVQGHVIAVILAADRPDIDPHELAGSLRPVAPGAADYYGPLPPEAPEGWVRQVRSGLSFALPPDFERFFADDNELGMGRADDLSLLEAPPPDFESTAVVVQLLDPREVEQDFMPVIERSEVIVAGEHLFFRRDMAMEQEGMKLRAVMLHSDATDRRDRCLSLLLVASNPADEVAALAEFETVLSTLRMNPSWHFEMPITEMSALDELFHVTLPRGWQSHFSGRGYRLFASGNDMAMLQSGMAAQATLEMPHAGFAEPPEISDGNFLGLTAQIARGRASRSVHISGGPMTLVLFDHCLPDGGPIMVTVAGSRHWEESDSLRAFVEGLRINLPEDSITCRPELGMAAVEVVPALEPPSAPGLEPVPSVKTSPLITPDEVAPWELHERVTVRVLRAWGQLPPRFDHLALQLRAHDIDLWDLDLADIRQLASDAASADTPWADFAQQLEELARHMADLTDTE